MTGTVEIVKTPGTLSGKPRIKGKRIGVHMLGDMIRRGEWAYYEVLEEFDVTRAELDAALTYYDEHPDEMDAERARDERARQQVLERSRAPGRCGRGWTADEDSTGALEERSRRRVPQLGGGTREVRRAGRIAPSAVRERKREAEVRTAIDPPPAFFRECADPRLRSRTARLARRSPSV